LAYHRYYKVFASGEGRKRAAIVINNRKIDTLLINQLSDENAIVLETKVDNTRIIIASLYFDINRPLDTDMQKIEATLAHAKGAGVIIAMDSNSRSTSWHDVLTDRRGKILEEFLMSKQLHIMNEESCYTTFRSSRGASNIDIRVANNQALDIVREWVISDQESCSDHSILKYVLGNGTSRWTGVNTGVRYKVTKKDSEKFQVNLLQLMEQRFCGSNSEVGETEELDETLSLRVGKAPNMETIVELHDVLVSACNSSFKILRTTKKASTYKSVPWWTEGLTILRKKVNAQRRQYQRTRGNNDLRHQRKSQYLAIKSEYAATIKKERNASWKEFCTMASTTNPWDEIYRLAKGKRKQAAQITTLRKPDGRLTTNLRETLTHMIRYFTPEDIQNDDNEYHKQLRAQTKELTVTPDDKEFTEQEIKNVVANIGHNKAPGEDVITSEIFKNVVDILSGYITDIHNGCLRSGTFPTRWKKAKILPITKPGKESSEEVSKFRPINLLNIGGKVLEKVLINGINHVFSQGFTNKNQYGFTSQKGTIDAAMEIKEIVKEGLAAGEVLALVSLDVKGAFDAAG